MFMLAWGGARLGGPGTGLDRTAFSYVSEHDRHFGDRHGRQKDSRYHPLCSTAAVTPDGKHVYAFGPNTSDFDSTFS